MEIKTYVKKYRKLKDSGFFKTLRSEVLWTIRNTQFKRIDDIQRFLGHKHSTIAARLSELYDSGVIMADYEQDGQTVYKIADKEKTLIAKVRRLESDIRLIKKLLKSEYIYSDLETLLLNKLFFLKSLLNNLNTKI